MKFSIIIPAYNEEKYITKCLQSVFSQQGMFDYEVIVVDNNSQDRTAEIVRNQFPRAKIIQEPKRMVTVIRNRGASEAKGDVLIFIDADVIVPSDHLKKLKNKFTLDDKIVAVAGSYNFFEEGFYEGLVALVFYQCLAFPAEYFFNRLLGLGCSVNAGNFAVRKTAFEKAGGFNEGIVFYGDEADIALRFKKLGKVRFLRDLTVKSSARRLKKEGAARSCFKYTLNLIWPHFFGKPLTKKHINIR